MKGHTELPWHVGRTAEDQIMLLGANDHYACNIQIYQTPRQFGLYAEAERKANAALILTAVNTSPAVTELVKALEGLIVGATAEFNEKGAGGYALARLSDARSALTHYRELAGTSNEVAGS